MSTPHTAFCDRRVLSAFIRSVPLTLERIEARASLAWADFMSAMKRLTGRGLITPKFSRQSMRMLWYLGSLGGEG